MNDRAGSAEPVVPTAALELRGVQKRYGDTTVVQPTSLRVEHGELVTLLGPSGSGKTTILRMIAGFAEPTRGEVLVGGHPITRLPAYKRNIGIVFQDYALFPHLSVFANVAFGLRMRRTPKPELDRRVRQSLAMVGLEKRAEAKPDELSGGQKQRVALARALVFEPSILLMDEPLAALDKRLREHLQLEIRRIQQDLRISVLYVTHDQSEAFLLSDRIGLMNGGSLVQVGAPQDLFLRPRTTFVGSFVGESNTIHGSIQSAGSEFVTQDGQLRIPVRSDQHQCSDGERVGLILRPASIAITPKTPPAGESVDLKGRLLASVFYGSDIHYSVEVAGLDGQSISVRSPASAESIPVGTAVTVSWRIDEAVIALHDE